MSEWLCEVVQVGRVEKHPNADSLSITKIHDGYPVIFRTGEFSEGDLAIYVPVDSIMPNTPQFSFLQGKMRIRAKKLRGVFSQGLLIPALPGMIVGELVHERLSISKWEPPEETVFQARGQVEKGPEGWTFPKYTDIEGLRRYKNILELGEEVVITEKCHGQNARFCWDSERLWCGSRVEIKKEDVTVNWWHVADRLRLAEKLSCAPKTVFFGEIYGKGIQKLTYDIQEKSFLVFDTFDVVAGKYNDWDTTVALAQQVGLPVVPVLYRGPWQGFDYHENLAEGTSTIASHIREGFVVKPVKERWNFYVDRVIFKLIGQGYLLEK